MQQPARRDAPEPEARSTTATLLVPGMGSDHCAGVVAPSLRRLDGIADVRTNVAMHRVEVAFDPDRRDGGATWEMAGPAPEGLIELAASPADPRRLYAATESGLLVSADAGRSWAPARPSRAPASSVAVARDGTVLAFVLDGGLQRATEPGLAWETVTTDTGGHILLHLALDPDDPRRLFAGSHHGPILASVDGGATWSPL